MTRILLVEDSKNLNRAFTMRLEHSGYAVITASHVEEAFAKALESPPKAAIVDVCLPGGNGFELTSRLRERLAIEVVLATANRDPSLNQRAHECGAFALLSKPFDASLLLATVADAIANANDSALA
ncbi:MAG: response regulator [Pseudomonadota bacterium]